MLPRLSLRTLGALGVLCGGVLTATLITRAQSGPAQPLNVGGQPDGSTMLPNGWRLMPAGKHVAVGDLPLAMAQSPDSKYLVVANNGISRPSFTVVDVGTWTVKSSMA